jgi:hypothetical protein
MGLTCGGPTGACYEYYEHIISTLYALYLSYYTHILTVLGDNPDNNIIILDDT